VFNQTPNSQRQDIVEGPAPSQTKEENGNKSVGYRDE
jgi:hypothetical protein